MTNFPAPFDNLPVTPVLSIAGGVLILLFPNLLSIVVAVYLIVTGAMELAKSRK